MDFHKFLHHYEIYEITTIIVNHLTLLVLYIFIIQKVLYLLINMYL